MKKCSICHKGLNVPYNPLTADCGGDCAECMADAGDLDVIRTLRDHGIATFVGCSIQTARAAATCFNCGMKGTVGVSTDHVIHKTMLCVTCTDADEVWP